MIGTRARTTLLSTATRLAWPSFEWSADRRMPGRTPTQRADDAARDAYVVRDASAIVLIPLRLFVGIIWLRAAAEKIIDPAWWDGSGVEAFVTAQLTAGAVAAEWCVWLARAVVLPNAQAVASVVVALETLTGLAILLGVATASFLVVGITMNVAFLLMGAVNPSAFYIPMQATLLMGDAGSVAGLERVLAADHARRFRRWHETVARDPRVWWLAAGVLAAIAAVATLQIKELTPTGLVSDPFAVLALLSGIGVLGSLIQAGGHGVDHRWRASTGWTTPAPTRTAIQPSMPQDQQPMPPQDEHRNGSSSATQPRAHRRGHPASGDTVPRIRPRRGRRQTARGLRLHHCQHDRSDEGPAAPAVTTTPEEAVRTYMAFVRDPGALRDEHAVAELEAMIERTDNSPAQKRLRRWLLDLRRPSAASREQAFIEHATAWADAAGVSGRAFAAEGVPTAVLRRAGFRDFADGERSPRRRRTTSIGRATGRRAPVTSDEVRAAIPPDAFTVKRLQELSGASAATVRRVIRDEVQAANLTACAADPDHSGPGQAPTMYERT